MSSARNGEPGPQLQGPRHRGRREPARRQWPSWTISSWSLSNAVLVQEASIIAGMRMLLDHAGLVVEPSAALGIGAILEDRDRFSGRRVVTIVCGSNVDVDVYHRWVGAAPIHRS